MIPNVPKGWEVRPLGELADFINGMAFKPSDWMSEGLPIIRIQNLNGSSEYNFYNKPVDSRNYVNAGDLLFSWSGSRGTSFGPFVWNNGKGILNQHIFRVVVNKEIDKAFLYHQLKHITEVIERRAHGSAGLVHVTKKELEKFQIMLPKDDHEQKRIAEILSTWDRAIETLEKLIVKKKVLKRGLSQELLSGKKRLPGFREKWRAVRLGDIADVKDGTHQTPTYVEQGIPFYSVESITNDNFNDTKYISKEDHRLISKNCKVEKGNILMTRIGSIGDCKLIDWDVEASFYVSLALLKVKSCASAGYITHFSKTNFFKRQLEKRSLQSAVPKKINLGEIPKIEILLPASFEEQESVSNILTSVDIESDRLAKIATLMRTQKKYLMQKLLTGKIRVSSGK